MYGQVSYVIINISLQQKNKHQNFRIHGCSSFQLLSRKALFINRKDNRNS